MQFALSRALLICAILASLSFATLAKKVMQQQQQPQPQQQPQQQKEQQQPQQGTKLKRDAALNFGHYHGPSHKYLPPAVSSGYESTYGSLHGNGLASTSGFDFASLDTDNTHHHHHHQQHQHHYQPQQQHHYQQYNHHSGHSRPVYISSGVAGSNYNQHQHQHHYQQQRPKVETYIVQTSNGHHQSHGNGLGLGSLAGLGLGSGGGYKYSGNSGSSGSYLSLLGSGQKQHGSTYLLATPSYHGLQHSQRPTLNLGAHHFAPALSHGLEEHEDHSSVGSVGYNYEAPSVHFKQPLSSYGVPLLPGYEHSQHDVVEEHQSDKSHVGSGQEQTPAYALGHKGLGHFSYTSSKPHALNTDIHQNQHHQHHSEELPFKPSAFLGAKHEPSNGFDFATPTAAGGYDYHAPSQSVLYGAPAQSGDSATPIFEPDSTYLPPVTSYGAPATPTHSYH